MSSVTNADRRRSADSGARSKRNSVVPANGTALRGRRTAIIQSMIQHLLQRKIQSTSLNDLAKAAGMSVSHLLYYFPNKEAVQEELTTAIVEQIAGEMNAYRFASPQKRIELLAEYNFDGESIPPAYRAMVLEQMALTMHDAKRRARAKKRANAMQSYLRDLFRGAPMAGSTSVDDAAMIAGALWIGLFITSYYYDPLTRQRARKIFERVLLQLAGLDGRKRS